MNILLFLGLLSFASGITLTITAFPPGLEMTITNRQTSSAIPGMTRKGANRLLGCGIITVVIGSLLIACAFR